MKSLLCYLLLCFSVQIARAKTISDEQFVRCCSVIYLQDNGYWDDYQPEHTSLPLGKIASDARHYIASLSFKQLRQQSQSAARLPLSHSAAVSVAYVSAINGVKPYHNARLMLNYREPTHPLWQFNEPVEDVYYRIRDIYKKFPDGRIALLLLEEQGSDGSGAEVAMSARLSLLTYQPRFILSVAMQSKQAFSRLAKDFVDGEPEQRDFRVLRRLCHDTDSILRRGARQIRHRVHIFDSTHHRTYPAT